MTDIVVIGAGPIGLASGIAARRRGLSCLIFDKGALVNSLLGYPTNMEFFSTPELLEIGGHPLPTHRYKPIREEAIDYYRRVAAAEELDLHLYEAVLGADRTAEGFVVHTPKGDYPTRNIIVATGFFDFPNPLAAPGADLPKVTHYYREPFAYTGQRVLIVGAKNSAAKAALDCYRHGADVTLAVRGPAISDSVKYWIKPDLENRIREGSIRAFFNTRVAEVLPDAVRLATPEGEHLLPNDWVLALTGYRPDYRLLESLGVAIGDDPARTPAHDPETFATNVPGLYLAGTICGGLNTSRWFIENARFHADRILDHILTLTHAARA